MLFALSISIIFVCLKQVFHDTIKTATDIDEKLGINLLASIPKVRLSKSKNKNRKRLNITDKSNGFSFTESYKALRTKMEMIAEKKGYKTFLVTSSLESEGKTTLAVNLSIALAGNGRKVLLIDADLRKPSIYTFIGWGSVPPHFGIDRVLGGNTPYESAIVNVEKYGISVLPNENKYMDSSELLSSNKMKNLIADASKKYDYIIIDSSPASILTDSVVITSYADAVILAIRQDYASARLVESVIEKLSENRADLVGCVFNIVDERGFDYGKYSNYSKYDRYGKYGNRIENHKINAGDGRGGAGMTDLHCHILHDIDDGPDNLNESLELCRIALDNQIDRIVATPHFNEFQEADNFLKKRSGRLNELRRALEALDMSIELYPGAEVLVCDEVFRAGCLSRLTINESRYLLVEFPYAGLNLNKLSKYMKRNQGPQAHSDPCAPGAVYGFPA